MNKNDIGKT